MAIVINTAKQLLERGITELPMLIEGVYPQTGLVALAGGSDTGKSSFLRQLAVSVCLGKKEFLGYVLNVRYKAVTYISTEDDENALASSLSRLSKNDELKPDVDSFYLITEMDSNSYLKDIDAHLLNNPCDVLIVDSVSDLINGDMNNQTTVRSFLAPFRKLSINHDCLIIFLHHLNKSAIGNPSKHQLNGSQAFEAKMRSVVILRKKDDYSSLKRDLQIVKGNYTSSEEKQKIVELLFDEKTLSFERVGESVSVKLNESENKLIHAISSMHKNGLTTRVIADKLTERGYKIGKTKVAEIIRTLN